MRTFIICLFFTFSVNIFAQDSVPVFYSNRNINIVMEYYHPKDDDRQIKSVFTYILTGKEFINKLHYSLYGGLIATYAWGNIIQWDANFKDVKYETKAFGVSPAAMLRVDFLRFSKFYLSGDFLVGAIFYNRNFPPGGDFYNLFRKYGIAFGVKITGNYELAAGLRDMHVSNGQGMNQHNPSYEGWGISLDLIKHL